MLPDPATEAPTGLCTPHLMRGSSIQLPMETAKDSLGQRALMLAVRFRAWLLGGVFTAGAMCFVVRDNGDVLLVRPSYRRGWGLPGGFMRTGEQSRDTILRELAEEVDIMEADPSLLRTYVSDGRRHIEHLYIARVQDHELPERHGLSSWLGPKEIASAAWHDLRELPPLQPEARAALTWWSDRMNLPSSERQPKPIDSP